MWGECGKSPGWFRINPKNHTGRRLYWFLGHDDLWVTNACREQVAKATLHGTPDPEWLASNLKRLTYDLLLLCGNISQETYLKCGYRPECRIVAIPHPAARMQTKELLEEYQEIIRLGVH